MTLTPVCNSCLFTFHWDFLVTCTCVTYCHIHPANKGTLLLRKVRSEKDKTWGKPRVKGVSSEWGRQTKHFVFCPKPETKTCHHKVPTQKFCISRTGSLTVITSLYNVHFWICWSSVKCLFVDIYTLRTTNKNLTTTSDINIKHCVILTFCWGSAL